MGRLRWESTSRPKKRLRDGIEGMRIYWDLHTGSPGAAGWLHTTVLDKGETAYVG